MFILYWRNNNNHIFPTQWYTNTNNPYTIYITTNANLCNERRYNMIDGPSHTLMRVRNTFEWRMTNTCWNHLYCHYSLLCEKETFCTTHEYTQIQRDILYRSYWYLHVLSVLLRVCEYSCTNTMKESRRNGTFVENYTLTDCE